LGNYIEIGTSISHCPVLLKSKTKNIPKWFVTAPINNDCDWLIVIVVVAGVRRSLGNNFLGNDWMTERLSFV
jgi:hypothetical protein